MAFQVRKAVRQRRPLKISLEGLSGSGKTYTGLRLLFAMRRAGIGKRVAVADSENGSASLYAGVSVDGDTWDFDVIDLPNESQNPDGYAAAYDYLVREGYDLILIDSMSHAWHGAMEKVDEIAGRNRGDKFQAWATVTPMQRKMLQAITDGRAHCVVTMRVKSEYERVTGANGKEKIKKVGLKTDQREGAEYEFDMVMRLDQDHTATVEKVRGCSALDGKQVQNPAPDFFQPLFDWWQAGAEYVSPLAAHAKAIEEAETAAELKTAFAAAWTDKRLTDEERQDVKAVYDERKAAFDEAAVPAKPEESGEERKAREFIEKQQAKAGSAA